MTSEEFLEEIQALLKAELPAGSYSFIEKYVIPDRAGIGKADLSGVLIMFVIEFRRDFVTKLAFPGSPNEWYNAPEVFLLIENRPYTPGSTSVGKSFDELVAQFRKVKNNLTEIRSMFSEERREETTQRLSEVRTRVMQPLMDMAEANRRKQK